MPGFRRFDFGDPALRGAFTRPAVTEGVFDGVHLGHQSLLARLVAVARARGVDPVVVTFWPHPRAVVGGGAPPLLCTLEHRVALLRRQGVAGVVVMRFDAEVASWEPEEYVERALGALGASLVVVGADHRFGRGRKGDVALLRSLGIETETVPLLSGEGAAPHASSTAARDAVRAGDLPRAEAVLGRPFAVMGPVVHGDARGRTLGFPTANLDLGDALLPPRGVYAVRARTVVDHVDGPLLPAVANVGRRPTIVADARDQVEVHLLEGGRDLYGLSLEAIFVARLRDERRFDGVEALKAQIARDAAAAREALV